LLLLINIDPINVTRSNLIEFRSANQLFNELWANALALCEWCGIEAVLHDGSETLAAIAARLESEDSQHILP